MNHLRSLFNLILNFDHSNMAAIDRNHNLFLMGALLSKKPENVLELGIGTGYVTWSLIFGIAYNQKGKLTSVDNLLDWKGEEPEGIQSIRDAGVHVIAPLGEKEFLDQCENDTYDFIISDADHLNADSWIDEYFRVAIKDSFLFFHDTNQAQRYPNLLNIEKRIKELRFPYFHFTENSRPDENCHRGWLFVINRK